jgi:hypothetical protein
MDESDAERSRETNSEISRLLGSSLVRNFRKIYGSNFATGHSDTATLREVINRLDQMSLQKLHRDYENGQLYQQNNSTADVWGRRPL